MLCATERKSISRAACKETGGIGGIVFDSNLLKFLHIFVPLREVMTYMKYKGICRFPICFLHCSGTCQYKRHGKEAFEETMKHYKRRARDKHTWMTLDEMDKQFGVTELSNEIEPQFVHDLSKQRITNLRGILDPTSRLKHYIGSVVISRERQ